MLAVVFSVWLEKYRSEFWLGSLRAVATEGCSLCSQIQPQTYEIQSYRKSQLWFGLETLCVVTPHFAKETLPFFIIVHEGFSLTFQ
jgi:hypothetical protein